MQTVASRPTSRAAIATRSSRKVALTVRSVFGGADKGKEAGKDAAFAAQQAILAARRAKRDEIMSSMGRKEAKGASKAAPPPAPARKAPARQQVVVQEEEEDEEEEAPKSGNPLSGLLGGLFGKK